LIVHVAKVVKVGVASKQEQRHLQTPGHFS